MIDNDTLHLVNAAIDGELSSVEMQRLGKLRAEQPEVASLYDETLAVTHMLQASGSAEPPGYLKERILAALPIQATEARPVQQITMQRDGLSFIDKLISLFQPQFALQLAVIFAGGLLIGGTVMRLGSTNGPVDPAHAIGTLGANTTQIAGAPLLVMIDGESVEAEVQLTRNADNVEVSFDGVANQPVELKFVYSPETLVFRGFSAPNSISGADMAAVDGLVTANVSGANSFSLTFGAMTAEQTQITLEIVRSDGTKSTHELNVAKGPVR